MGIEVTPDNPAKAAGQLTIGEKPRGTEFGRHNISWDSNQSLL